MKIYSYLHSGKAVVATDIFSHTQVLSDNVAVLSAPEVSEFAAGMRRVVEDKPLRAALGAAGRDLVEREYSYPAFRRKVGDLYRWLDSAVVSPPGT